ncbi:MAG: NAD(P)H-dependent oxidoreductase [bacterium]|jgi:FMN reductase|nr:NAD(P)H-dependent oxidoreductase [bacterium]
MKTLILSSSLSPTSRSRLLCRRVEDLLAGRPGVELDLVDLREVELRPCHLGKTASMRNLAERIATADNYIFGMGVHCYTVNDGLKIVLDTCMKGCDGKFFGILCAAGGEKSYLSTMHLTQICMNEWRMIQLPRVVYVHDGDFHGEELASPAVEERLVQFADEFASIGRKLLA